MFESLKKAPIISLLITALPSQNAKSQTDVYNVLNNGVNTHVTVGTTSGNAPSYINNDINQSTTDNSCVVQIRRGGVIYSISSLIANISAGSNSITVGSTSLYELDPISSNTGLVNGFKDGGGFGNSLPGGPYVLTRENWDGEENGSSVSDGIIKGTFSDVNIPNSTVDSLSENDEIWIKNRSSDLVGSGVGIGGKRLILKKVGGVLIVYNDDNYDITLDTEEFNALTLNYVLFPNPATAGGEINISGITDTYAVEGHTYVIYDMMGRVVGEVKKGNGPISVPTTPGIYNVVVLTADNKKISKRIIVE